jgi:hypothetical protein
LGDAIQQRVGVQVGGFHRVNLDRLSSTLYDLSRSVPSEIPVLFQI